jgi:hypothetical protein
MAANYVLPCVPTNNEKYISYYYFEIIKDVLFSCLDAFNCDTWCHLNLPHGALIEFFQIQFKSIFRYVG